MTHANGTKIVGSGPVYQNTHDKLDGNPVHYSWKKSNWVNKNLSSKQGGAVRQRHKEPSQAGGPSEDPTEVAPDFQILMYRSWDGRLMEDVKLEKTFPVKGM